MRNCRQEGHCGKVFSPPEEPFELQAVSTGKVITLQHDGKSAKDA